MLLLLNLGTTPCAPSQVWLAVLSRADESGKEIYPMWPHQEEGRRGSPKSIFLGPEVKLIAAFTSFSQCETPREILISLGSTV